MTDKYIVIIPPPTPNGNLHLGHIAGPFLAGDVFSRFRRAQGDEVLYTTGTDDNQSYVVTAAAKKGCDPAELCRTSTQEIEVALKDMQIEMDGFAPFDAEYRETCVKFLTELNDAGKFTWREREFLVRPNGDALFEAHVKGKCPICLAGTSGGLCETCGHPNNYAEILDPTCAIDPNERLARRSHRILVFELEKYRERLSRYYEEKRACWRPHICRLMAELLSKPLPEFPVTYPGSWGIPAPFRGAEGQVINAWAEGMPASMYCTAIAGRNRGMKHGAADELWKAEHGYRLVYFLGFDNSYFWGMSHLALLMATDGKYILPETIVPNEFYELENEKFSTSKGHVIWASDLAKEFEIDAIRFHLCWTNPEHHRTNFSRRELVKLLSERLVPLWASLVENMSELPPELRGGDRLAVSAEGKARALVIQKRLSDCYALATFSLRDAVNAILMQVERLEKRSKQLAAQLASHSAGVADTDPGDLWLELQTLLAMGAPVVTAWEAYAAGTVDVGAAESVEPFRVPEFHLRLDPAIRAEGVRTRNAPARAEAAA